MVAVAETPTPSVAPVRFFCRGVPVTKGSKRFWHEWMPQGRCIVSMSEQGGPKLKEWEMLLATAAKRAAKSRPPLDGPVRVELTFYFPRPQSHTKLQRLVRWVWGNKKWDVDKLQRAAFDAMTNAAIWHDDSQVAKVTAEKVYVEGSERPGVICTVEALT